jgi:ribosomal-protein-alanine N-acetyltransferase
MNYHRELENQLATYLVMVERPSAGEDASTIDEISGTGVAGKVKRWMASHEREEGRIIAFGGFWIMAGEAHIIGLAVRKDCRRQGLGRLMLRELIEEAAKRQSHCMTLEVRAGNYGAQKLYSACGFVETGIRRAYYTDNREDALIMTLIPLPIDHGVTQ